MSPFISSTYFIIYQILYLQSAGRICWPDDAVPAITALERATHETLGLDFQKYNQKMRQLDFNLKVE